MLYADVFLLLKMAGCLWTNGRDFGRHSGSYQHKMGYLWLYTLHATDDKSATYRLKSSSGYRTTSKIAMKCKKQLNGR